VATRSAVVGFTAAGVAGVLLSARRAPWRTVTLRLFVIAFAATAVVGVLMASPLGDRVRATFVGIAIEDRLAIYRTAIAAFESRPLLGYGPDGFGVSYPANRDERDALILGRTPQSSAHSWILQALTTTGVFGLMSLLVVIAIAIGLLWTIGMTRAPWLAGPLLVGLAAYWADGLVAIAAVGVDWFAWLAFGATAGLTGERASAIHAVRPLPTLVSIVFVLAALGVASSTLVALSAAEQVGQARILWLRKSTDAVKLASDALRRDPGRAVYWNWLGLAHDLTSQWKASGDAYAEAARRAPHNSTFWANLARSRARQTLVGDDSSGGASAAIAAASRGVEEDPNDPEANFVLGEMASLFGQSDLALPAAVNAVVLYPLDSRYDPIVLRAARGATGLRLAAFELDRALRAKDTVILRVAAGEVSLRRGDIPTARVHARRAAELAPTDADVVRLLRALPPN
jgi:tetratricopeptide (TPR) repeat protein